MIGFKLFIGPESSLAIRYEKNFNAFHSYFPSRGDGYGSQRSRGIIKNFYYKETHLLSIQIRMINIGIQYKNDCI